MTHSVKNGKDSGIFVLIWFINKFLLYFVLISQVSVTGTILGDVRVDIL